jgi:hypothetical protein
MNCKPGDLAYVIRAVVTPEMVGAVVSVLRSAVHMETVDGIRYEVTEPGWVVESAGSSLPVRSNDGILRIVKRRVVMDRLLRPISGVPVNDEVTEDLKEPA